MSGQEDEAGKIFVGGLARQTDLEGLRTYFGAFGTVTDCVLMKDKETGHSRGFGFVTFADPASVELVVKGRPHTLDSKVIDPKPCTSKSAQQQKKMSATNYTKAHKIFIGGISMETTEAEVQGYFERYGSVVEVVFVVNKEDTSRPHKGFGFVTFEDESSVDQAITKHYHIIKDKRVEAKKAEARDKMAASGGGGGRNDQQQGYGPNSNNNMWGGQGGINQGGGNWMGGQNMMGNYGYGNQGFPTSYPQQQGYGSNPYGGYGGYGYGNMGGNMGGPGYQGGMMGVNNGGGQNNMGNYPQNQSGFGPMGSGAGYNQGGNNPNNGANGGNYKSGSGGGGSNPGYHPYRR